MFEGIGNFFKKIMKQEEKEIGSKDSAKERLHLVLMQDRANVSADFLELMKQEIIDVIKKYIVVDETSIDVRLTNQPNDDGTNGAPALYANIPIMNIKNDMKAEKIKEFEGVNFSQKLEEAKKEEQKQEKAEETMAEMIEGAEKEADKKTKKTKTEKKTKKVTKKKDVKKEEKEENSEVEEESKTQDVAESEKEEEDDDVTFDDLLKAAEEEDNKKVSEG